jgi:hypothetical protein
LASSNVLRMNSSVLVPVLPPFLARFCHTTRPVLLVAAPRQCTLRSLAHLIPKRRRSPEAYNSILIYIIIRRRNHIRYHSEISFQASSIASILRCHAYENIHQYLNSDYRHMGD